MGHKMMHLKICLLLLLNLAIDVLSYGVITDLKVSSRIEQRYAQTTVTSTMKNTNSQSTELKFKMTLPKTAFISSLIMEIEGTNYTSIVKEKAAARKTYDRAKQRGKTTGLVEQRDDTEQKFEVSANVAAEGKVTFYLQYEELLRRVKGRYFYTVKIKPGHVVPAVAIEVYIIENEAIKDLKIIELPGKEDVEGDYSRYVSVDPLRPGEVQLAYYHEDSSGRYGEGLDGSFSLSYDVDMQPDGGEVQVVGKFFVHHFSPEGLPKMPVHTIFVLDVSQSMEGGKIEQLKEAMETILKDLRSEDTFELIAFATEVKHLGTFSGEKKGKALRIVRKLKLTGATNLHGAYMMAVMSISAFNETKVAKQIVLLTDGVPTHGVTDGKTIRRDIRETNDQRHPIFGLAFGKDADFGLLKKISADNRAFARKIAFDENTQDQLTGFYEEISTPLIAEVDINYLEYEVEPNSIVKQGTTNFYSGGEVVSAGQVAEGVTEVRPVVTGVGKEGPLQFRVQRLDSRTADSSSERDNFVARLWAYLMVQDLLEQSSVSEDENQITNLKKEALGIALRFNFVTKLTSLVVVRPEDELETPILEENQERPKKARGSSGHSSPSGRPIASDSRPRGPSGRQITANLHFGVYPAKQMGGSPLRSTSNNRISFGDNDPHFVVSAPGMTLPFCFDLHVQDGAVLSLIKDPPSGITVNGQVTSAVGRPDMTYFTRMYLAFDQLTITVTPDSIQMECPQDEDVVTSLWPFYMKDGRVFTSAKSHGRKSKQMKKKKKNNRNRRSAAICNQYTTWKSAAGKRFGDVMLVLPKKKQLHILVGDGEAHLVVVRSKNKYGQPFLGLYLQDERIFSANTTGIIGEFPAKNVTMASAMGDINSNSSTNNNTMVVSVYRRNHHKEYEMSEVSGFLSHRRSLLDKVRVRCLHVRNSGRRLLDGNPHDYIVPCLSC